MGLKLDKNKPYIGYVYVDVPKIIGGKPITPLIKKKAKAATG